MPTSLHIKIKWFLKDNILVVIYILPQLEETMWLTGGVLSPPWRSGPIALPRVDGLMLTPGFLLPPDHRLLRGYSYLEVF